MSKGKSLIFEADLSLGVDWLFWMFDEYGSDVEGFLQELERALILDDGYPAIDFLKMSDLKHDLDMRAEVEADFVKMDYVYKNISEQEYKHKIENIQSIDNKIK